MILVLESQTKVRSTPSPRPKSGVLQHFRWWFGFPGRCAKDAGEMCKGCRGDVQRLPGRCARVAGEMCKGCRGDVQRSKSKVNF